MKKKIGLFGSCQLAICGPIFLTTPLLNDHNLEIAFCLPFYEYDNNYPFYNEKTLDYSIFYTIDILIIEVNNLSNQASSTNILNYCKQRTPAMQIIQTCLVKFPIFPLNWSGYGENKKDYLMWEGLDKINYKEKFNKLIRSMKIDLASTDLDESIADFVNENFHKRKLFSHSLHPTNVLLFLLWKCILAKLQININLYHKNFERDHKEILNCMQNPFTTKMMHDLKIEFYPNVDDQFYINKYEENKDLQNI